MEIVEAQEGWSFSFKEGRVELLQIDFRLTVFISDGRSKAWFCVETPCKLNREDIETALVPSQSQTLAPILTIFNAVVTHIRVSKTGTLAVEFEKGAALHVAPHGSYEAWQLACSTDQTELMLVCQPGGAVAVFRESRNPQRARN